MTEVIRSMMRFSWAMSLFGVRQAQEMLEALGMARAPRRATASFDAVSEAAERQLGEDLGDAFRTGDRWQRELIDAVFGIADPAIDFSRGMTSRTVLRGSLTALRQSASLLEAAMPSANRPAWRELRNKLEAFDSFQFADRILGFKDLRAATLRERVEEAGGSGPYLRLWLTEGLGFAFAETAWTDCEPADLLRRPALDRLPAESLIPLHTGMGLSLARHLLPDLAAGGELAETGLRRFADLCDGNAREEYALATYEALGLVVRQLAPEAVDDIDRQLRREDAAAERLGAFWHGLGRGLYFVATQTLPGSTGRAVDKIRREAPAGPARLNALAGLVWALTLVNFRQPEILEAFLADQRLSDEEGSAVANGVSSAVLLWSAAAGDDSHLEAFRGHRPARSASRWERLVSRPCADALAGWHELRAAPGAIFYYRGG